MKCLALFRLVGLFLILATLARSQIIFSEIMFDVPGVDYHDEFVELYNSSADSSIDLEGWRFSDSSGVDLIMDAGHGTLLEPRKYAVILDGSYFDNSTTYDQAIPDSALIVTINDGAFGNSGLSNSKGERLTLSNADGLIVQTYRYSVDNEPGFSDEKILMTANNDPGNWDNCLVAGGTPGYENSVSPRRWDIGFADPALSWLPESLISRGQTVLFTLHLRNVGLQTFSDSVRVLLFVDANGDSTRQPHERAAINSRETFDLQPGEETVLSAEWQASVTGKLRMVASLSSGRDQNRLNNLVTFDLYVRESRQTVIINEIKFLTRPDEPEWLELYNTGDQPVQLQDWAIADQRDTCRLDSAFIILPGQFKVIAGDRGLSSLYAIDDSLIFETRKFPTLNNDRDVVFLLAPGGEWIEQVPYSIDWLEGEDYRLPSLERIQPQLDSRLFQNWGPCTDGQGATPAGVNSVFSPAGEQSDKVSVEPNPFSPDGDGFEDHALVSIENTLGRARAKIVIYDISGRRIRILLDDTFAGSHISTAWNGRRDDGRMAKMGIYIIFVQLIDDLSGRKRELKTSVVLAHRL